MRNDGVEASLPAGTAPTSEPGIPVKVDFISNIVDARTGTIELRATFANPDLRFVPGELIDVAVRLETLPQTVFVPHEAVNVGQAGSYVFVIGSDNKAEMRPVQVVYEDSFITALGTGLKAGERVVIDGQLRLSPGTPVSIVGSTADTPAAEAPAQPNVQSSARPQAANPPATAQRVGESDNARGG